MDLCSTNIINNLNELIGRMNREWPNSHTKYIINGIKLSRRVIEQMVDRECEDRARINELTGKD